jgi:peptidyl-tRNA hydrolase
MTYTRDTTATSELTGQPVSTWSKEWQHECEAKAVLAVSKQDRDVFFNGSTGENGQRKEAA